MAWGRSEPFQGSWAYLGPRGVTPGAIAQFLGAWEARKKEFFIYFGLHQLKSVHFKKTGTFITLHEARAVYLWRLE